MVVFTGLWTGLISAYGKRALILSMTGVLTFVYAMGRHFPRRAMPFFYLELFTAGRGALRALCRLSSRCCFDDRARRLLLAEAMRGFADLSARQGRALQSRHGRPRAPSAA